MDGDCQMLMRYNLCYLSLILLVNCCPWKRELPPVRVRVYSSLIYALTVCLFQIYWSCMYFNFNCMLSNYLFLTSPMFWPSVCARISKLQVISLVEGVEFVCIFLISISSRGHSPSVFHQTRLQSPTFPGFQHSFSLFLLQKINFLTWLLCSKDLISFGYLY